MMETLSNPPSLTRKSYEQFKQETLAWAHITDISKKNQAIVVALNLPEDDQQKIKEKVFDEIGDLSQMG